MVRKRLMNYGKARLILRDMKFTTVSIIYHFLGDKVTDDLFINFCETYCNTTLSHGQKQFI